MGRGGTSNATTSRSSTTMAHSSRGGKSSNSDTTPTLRSISGENVEHGRWNEESPWEYMTFLTDIEEVDVDIEEFNELVGYDKTYRPQGFTRVADKRLNQLSGEESVETAIADLTDAGERVHPVDDEDDGPTPDLADQLQAASTDGNAHEEFEKTRCEGLLSAGLCRRLDRRRG